jgi:hypothetical protein
MLNDGRGSILIRALRFYVNIRLIIASQPLHRIDYDMGKYNWDIIADQVAGIYQSMM